MSFWSKIGLTVFLACAMSFAQFDDEPSGDEESTEQSYSYGDDASVGEAKSTADQWEGPVVVIATHNAMYEKVLSNIQEIKARQGRVIALVSKGDDTISKIADEVIELPDVMECLEPLVATIPLQLLAYHVAVCKGKNVDQPRNLAKSVTVE